MTWEERWHPLREEWVVVAAHRQNRPWNGETVGREEAVLPDCLPDCYLCPGAERVSGKRNDDYTCTLVFDNDHPCVGPDAPRRLDAPPGVYRNRPATGVARVVCYSPRHNLTLAEAEREDGRRIIFENESAMVFLPYFARYAYEAFVAPKASHPSIATLSEAELRDFAEALKLLLVKFDNLWRRPFPYVMLLHQAPTDGGDHRGFHFHIEFHPPLRRPNLLKYLAGPEVGGGNFLSDTSPEEKAAELRAQPDVHYKQSR